MKKIGSCFLQANKKAALISQWMNWTWRQRSVRRENWWKRNLSKRSFIIKLKMLLLRQLKTNSDNSTSTWMASIWIDFLCVTFRFFFSFFNFYNHWNKTKQVFSFPNKPNNWFPFPLLVYKILCYQFENIFKILTQKWPLPSKSCLCFFSSQYKSLREN